MWHISHMKSHKQQQVRISAPEAVAAKKLKAQSVLVVTSKYKDATFDRFFSNLN